VRVLPLAGVNTTAHTAAGALSAVSGLPLDVHPDELRRRFHATEKHDDTPLVSPAHTNVRPQSTG